MSRRRSGSPSVSKFEHSLGTNHSSDNIANSRRPSWAHSLADSTIPEDSDTRIPHSQSQRRKRQFDETSLEWSGSVSSLLKARRPSFALSTSGSFQRARQPRVEAEDVAESTAPVVPGASRDGLLPSPEEGKGLRSSWEINVKDLVGDAVGNMSISPTSRDIVLAARRGLFIIDLESPFSIPRFLPQGGTWDVADVQWNPHPSHAQYIVSTSSERLLIWNLYLGGKTSIEHILRSHYRAITDINWHTTECDVVVSTGIDSWLWAWDLREPGKPIFGLSAFNAGATQVKWNRQDGNLLASSHSNEVLIWDRRKGSLPVTQIRAHSSKIYGIDWSHSCRNEIVTCSLDKSIKIWDITATDPTGNPEPKSCIRTTYPVWRARNLPFGEGILSLPQRSETTLEMYAKGTKDEAPHPIETFEGHSDVVKEFVWRRGSQDDFQLITWSKDRTLRFWPIDSEVMQKVGHVPEVVRGRSKLTRTEMEFNDTFRNEPETEARGFFPLLSAPIGNRGILAEVRAPRTAMAVQTTFGVLNEQPKANLQPADATPTLSNARSISIAATRSIGGTMSKGGTGAKSTVQVDQLAWLRNVKVGNKRGSSSGGGSGGGSGSGGPSRLNSRSRPPSGPDRSASEVGSRKRSGSLIRSLDERKEGEGNQSLQDEITTVLKKLAALKVVLEKHELTKKRTCTLGLHGPWGETSNLNVFMRVTFTFPRGYPHAQYPEGTPTVELERNSLIPSDTRALILKHLRHIREQNRPCLEACLRFLLFGYEGESEHDLSDFESSSDEEYPPKKKSREVTNSWMRNTKNLAEPRTSQGAFGPNGELICFFRSPTRIVRNVLRDLTKSSEQEQAEEREPSPAPSVQETLPPEHPHPQTSYFQSPALVSDAVRRLGLAATDRVVRPIDPKQPELGLNILRAMTNLLTVPQQKARRDSDSKQAEENPKNYALLPTRRSTVFLISTRNIAGADPVVVDDYVFTAGSLAEVCEKNAVAAKNHGRFDHERVFRTLRTLFKDPDTIQGKKERGFSFVSDALAAQIITRLYHEIAKEKDIQMLAMISALVLQTEHATIIPPSIGRKKIATPAPSSLSRGTGMDYFSLAKSLNVVGPMSPAWPRLPSPVVAPSGPSLSTSNSSRGSWSSLFNPVGPMRQWVQDNFKEGSTTPGEPATDPPNLSRLGEKGLSRLGGGDSPGSTARRKRTRKDSSTSSPLVASRSWNDDSSQSSKMFSASFSSAGHKQPSLRFAGSNTFIHEKRSVIFEPPIYEESSEPLFELGLIEQFKFNTYFYSEILFRWQFYSKRLELLNAVKQQDGLIPSENKEVHRIGLHRVCTQSNCRTQLPKNAHVCPQCNTASSMPACTICRLPVKGLSRTCLTCSHVTHISCWNRFEVTVPICPSGCGCFCTGTDQPFTRPSTRLGLTPPSSTLLLAPELR